MSDHFMLPEVKQSRKHGLDPCLCFGADVLCYITAAVQKGQSQEAVEAEGSQGCQNDPDSWADRQIFVQNGPALVRFQLSSPSRICQSFLINQELQAEEVNVRKLSHPNL